MKKEQNSDFDKNEWGIFIEDEKLFYRHTSVTFFTRNEDTQTKLLSWQTLINKWKKYTCENDNTKHETLLNRFFKKMLYNQISSSHWCGFWS